LEHNHSMAVRAVGNSHDLGAIPALSRLLNDRSTEILEISSRLVLLFSSLNEMIPYSFSNSAELVFHRVVRAGSNEKQTPPWARFFCGIQLRFNSVVGLSLCKACLRLFSSTQTRFFHPTFRTQTSSQTSWPLAPFGGGGKSTGVNNPYPLG